MSIPARLRAPQSSPPTPPTTAIVQPLRLRGRQHALDQRPTIAGTRPQIRLAGLRLVEVADAVEHRRSSGREGRSRDPPGARPGTSTLRVATLGEAVDRRAARVAPARAAGSLSEARRQRRRWRVPGRGSGLESTCTSRRSVCPPLARQTEKGWLDRVRAEEERGTWPCRWSTGRAAARAPTPAPWPPRARHSGDEPLARVTRPRRPHRAGLGLARAPPHRRRHGSRWRREAISGTTPPSAREVRL